MGEIPSEIVGLTQGSESWDPISGKDKSMQQLTLPMTYFPFAEYLGGFRRIRKAVPKAKQAWTPWRQLPLKLYVRKLVKKGTAFIWTRPDGRQFFCKTICQLVARIMDYDGHLLKGVLRMA